jgi:hypothetical protein
MSGASASLELGASALLPVGELRSGLRYGGARAEEHQGIGLRTSSFQDFAAANVAYCYSVGKRATLAGCGGFELGVVRTSWREEMTNGWAAGDELDFSLRSTAAVLLAWRGARIQPEILLSAGWLTAFGTSQSERVSLRAGLGAAVAF